MDFRFSDMHQPIVALTAHAVKRDQERCEAAGMDGYLAKPIRPEELDGVQQKYMSGLHGEVAALDCAVCRSPIITTQGPLSITLSVGVVASRGLDLVTVEEFLCEVDRALYTAKAAGRNCSRLAGVGV